LPLLKRNPAAPYPFAAIAETSLKPDTALKEGKKIFI